jgi:hypothetical protein
LDPAALILIDGAKRALIELGLLEEILFDIGAAMFKETAVKRLI